MPISSLSPRRCPVALQRMLMMAATTAVGSGPAATGQSLGTSGEWSSYGHDSFGTRFSPLTQITRANVASLKVAWTYRTGDAAVDTRRTVKFEATPLMVEGTLYLST